jgi:uncharacterized protein (UPF0335 family)
MEWEISLELLIITPLNDGEPSTPVVVLITTKEARERRGEMAKSAEPSDAALHLQVVRAFLERYFTIENEIKVLQQDKSALRDEFKGQGLDMKTMTAAIAIAKKRQLVPVSKETLDALISEVENKLPAPED